jgi:hypothetical protein
MLVEMSTPHHRAGKLDDQRLGQPPDATAIVQYHRVLGERTTVEPHEFDQIGRLALPPLGARQVLIGEDDLPRFFQRQNVEHLWRVGRLALSPFQHVSPPRCVKSTAPSK